MQRTATLGWHLSLVTNFARGMVSFVLGESGFTKWSEWTPCSTTCGQGEKQRNRMCKDGASAECAGESVETLPCPDKDCPGMYCKVISSNRVSIYQIQDLTGTLQR